MTGAQGKIIFFTSFPGDKTTEKFEVFKKYKNGAEKRDGRFYINLWAVVKQDLLKFGILSDHLEMSMVCTAEADNQFASHHIEGVKRKATNVSLIAIN